jgi:DNA polymerase-3 subunit gamma/tau
VDYQVSARKYRPGTFDDVIGQPHVVQTLVNSLTTRRIAQAYLFSGTRGVGKTTVARILAKALNCEQGPTGTPCASCANCLEIAQGTSVDVIEVDGASNTSVDDVREIRENVKFTPFRGQYRIYIIDEVHMLSNSAFNALLKTLEEPPPHVVFIFATTEIHKIPATILSRCQHYSFRRIARAEIIDRLRRVAAQDGITIEESSLTALARASEGSMRDGLSLLDQAVAFGGKKIVHRELETLLGAVPQELLRAMVRAIVSQDSAAALRVIAQLLDQGHDLRAFCADMVEYLRHMLVAGVTPVEERPKLIEASAEELVQLQADSSAFSPEQTQQIFAMFSQAEDALRLSAHPRFVMEIAAVRATRLRHRENEPSSQRVQAASADRPSQAGQLDTNRSMVPKDAAGQPLTPSPVRPAESLPQPPKVRPGLATTPSPSVKNPTPVQSQPVVPRSRTAPASAGAVTVDWERFQEQVAQAFPNIAPFLEMGRLVGIEGNVVTIGFSKQATVARAMLEKADNIQSLASLCEGLCGKAVRLRVVEQSDADTATPTMAQLRAAKEQEHKLVMFERAKAHPVVKQALEIFGAELADVRPIANAKEVQE